MKKLLDIHLFLMRRTKTFLILLFSLSIFTNVFCQSQAQPFSSSYEVQKVPANPDVAQLGKFGDVPVNKYNGTANISVPIYEIDLEGLKIPIALKYNTSGVRVEQEASWVGLGWSLSDGITITREVNGYEDIYDLTDLNAKSQGWIYSRDYLFPDAADNYAASGELSETDLVELQVKLQSPSSQVDLQPDFFTVNVPSGSCKFTLPKIVNGATSLVATIADDANFKVVYDRVAREFTVTDPQGFVYKFDVKEYSTGFGSYDGNDNLTMKGVVAGIVFPNFQSREMISSWRVSQITAPLGRVLTFAYEDGFYFSYPHFSESQDIVPGNSPTFLSVVDLPIYQPVKMFGTMTAFNVKNLSLISGDFGSVDFVFSDRSDLLSKQDKLLLSGWTSATAWNTFITRGDAFVAKKVDQVIVRNKASESVKTATLTYSYFNAAWVGVEPDNTNGHDPFQSDISYIRLKLDQVDIGDQKYQFEYYQPNSLPAKYSKSVDFWGFNNGIANATKIPSFNRFYVNHPGPTKNDEWHEYFLKVTGGNRTADIDYGKIGILQKVIYPTGGYTSLEYEGHKVTMSNITFQTTQFLSDGSGLRFTNLTSSKDYKYSYQYMKLAKTPAYSLNNYNTYYNPCKVSSNLVQPGTNFQVSETSFCNGQTFNVKISATINCSVGCGQATPSGRAVWIRNVNTNQEYDIFFFNNPVIDQTQNLPAGTYQLLTANWTQNSPLVVVLTTASINVYYTEFVPAPNIPIVDEEFAVGGARIKSVSNYDIDGSFISKSNYLYDQYVTENGQQVSNSKLMDELVFHSKARNLYDYTALDFGQNANGAGAVLGSDAKLMNNPSAQGSHIGYSLVREENVDSFGNKSGQTVTEFTNLSNEYVFKPTEDLPEYTLGGVALNDFHSTIDDLFSLGVHYYRVTYGSVYILGSRPIIYDYLNGSVLKERIYDQANNLKTETNNTYTTYQILSYQAAPGVGGGQNPIVYFFPNSIIHFQPYFKIQGGQYKLNLKQQLTSSTTTEYLNGSQFSTTTDNYFENTTHFLMTRTATTNSDGSLNTTKYYYPKDLPAVPFMSNLVAANRVTSPIVVERYKGTTPNPYASLLEKVQTFYSNTNSITADVLPSTVFTYTAGDVVGHQRVLYEKYSNNGTLIQYRKSSEDVPVTLLWGHNKLFPIAKVNNAVSDQVAFTSFDEFNIMEGGWTITGVTTAASFKTGTKCFDTGGAITKSGLATGTYVVGFWAKVISGGSGTVTINGTPMTITDTNWKYYETTWNGTSATITNSNVYLDELRLHPLGAQMTSFTYKPHVGMTSQMDPNGNITFYEYDASNRLVVLKDTSGNVLKTFQYHYYNGQ